MIKKKIVSILIISLMISSQLIFAEEEPKVDIQKTEGRLEAVVSSQPTPSPQPKKKILTRITSAPGDLVVATGRITSGTAGKIADVCIKSFQTVGGFLLAPVFRTLDIQTKLQKKQDSKT